MNATACILLAHAALVAMSSVSGQVVGPEGGQIRGALVFLESGLEAPLARTTTADDGSFHFTEVPTGSVGVFAVSDGYSFSGATVTVPVSEYVSGVTIQLRAPGTVQGRAVDSRGKPVAAARIIRFAILGDGYGKVGIPLAKLSAFGFKEPVSDKDGLFTVSLLPEGAAVVLKVAHPDFAQEAAQAVGGGDHMVRVTLGKGVLLHGEVVSRDQGIPVANMTVTARNLEPPHDSVLTRTDGRGSFAVRLKPGTYLLRAASESYSNPGWEGLTVSDESLEQRVTLRVAGTGTIRGEVRDAVSGEPLSGARLVLETHGNVAAVLRTGHTGKFEMSAAEGENLLRLGAAPGFLSPQNPVTRVHVTRGRVVELPTFWLAPIPPYHLQILDDKGLPVHGAVVTMRRPAQFAWHRTDAAGKVELRFASMPSDGAVIGMAEHPTRALGALFSVPRAKAGGAQVQLLPLARVSGRIVNKKGNGLGGVVVSALYEDEEMDWPVPLWLVLTQEDGGFEWPAVVPYVPMRCMVTAGEEALGQPMAIYVEPATRKDLGSIVVPDVPSASAAFGKPLKWYENRLLCGSLPGKGALGSKPTLVLYPTGEEMAMVVAGLTDALPVLEEAGLLAAVVVDGPYPKEDTPFPVLSGRSPSLATTFLVDPEGTVVLETFGMPPLAAIRRLTERK